MDWQGKTLAYREDWEQALLGLTTKAQAEAFLASVREVRPLDASFVVGYMTSEVPGYYAAREKRRLLGVKHPFYPEDKGPLSQMELLQMGMKGDLSQPWFRYVMSIPRRDRTLPSNIGPIEVFPEKGIPLDADA